jgi:hypothetical protein
LLARFLPSSRLDERRGRRVEIMAAAIVPERGTQVTITRDLVALRAIYEPIHARRIAGRSGTVVSVAPERNSLTVEIRDGDLGAEFWPLTAGMDAQA